ncbi:MAG: adenylate kinase [Proteobacteria bacterium]|nr:adenylate kinase [Pseudomonadota bacterium]
MDLILFGPPGAGKGTQAHRLSKLLGIPSISTGDLMRAERAGESDLGKKFDSYMSQGLLVPDTLVVELLEGRLGRADAAGGAIFDGYPRTLPQALALDELLASADRAIQHVVSIDIELDEMLERITGRRACQATGQIFHLRYNPPPADFQGTLVQRPDDTEAVVRKRYEEYTRKTAPLKEHYGDRGLLRAVDGVGALDQVAARIRTAIGWTSGCRGGPAV